MQRRQIVPDGGQIASYSLVSAFELKLMCASSDSELRSAATSGQTVAEAADDALGDDALGEEALGDGLLAVLPPPDEQPATSSTALSSAAPTRPGLIPVTLPGPPRFRRHPQRAITTPLFIERQCPQPSRPARCSPTRIALAMAVSAGFTAPMLGKKLVSTT